MINAERELQALPDNVAAAYKAFETSELGDPHTPRLLVVALLDSEETTPIMVELAKSMGFSGTEKAGLGDWYETHILSPLNTEDTSTKSGENPTPLPTPLELFVASIVIQRLAEDFYFPESEDPECEFELESDPKDKVVLKPFPTEVQKAYDLYLDGSIDEEEDIKLAKDFITALINSLETQPFMRELAQVLSPDADTLDIQQLYNDQIIGLTEEQVEDFILDTVVAALENTFVTFVVAALENTFVTSSEEE